MNKTFFNLPWSLSVQVYYLFNYICDQVLCPTAPLSDQPKSCLAILELSWGGPWVCLTGWDLQLECILFSKCRVITIYLSASLPRLDCPITPIRRLRLQDSSFGAFLQLCALFASKEKIINDSTGSNLIWWAKTGPKLVLVLSVWSYYYYCTVFPLWPLGWLFTRLWSDPCLMCPLVSGDQCTMGNFGSPGRHFRRS